ncbi:MAG TPA: hypothetical protein VF678_16605 [bacterium]
MGVLEIQAAQHEQTLGYIDAQAKKRPRSHAESAAFLDLCLKQREAWVEEGGTEAECVLNPLIADLQRETQKAAEDEAQQKALKEAKKSALAAAAKLKGKGK